MKKNILLIFILQVMFCMSCKDDEVNYESALIGRWEANSFASLESVFYPKDNNYSPVVEFKANGEFSLFLDKNTCTGSYTLSDNRVLITGGSCSEICCDSKFSEKFAGIISKTETFTVLKDTLNLNVPEWGFIILTRDL